MKTEKEVGIVLHFLIQKGWVPFYRKDERLEIVVRKNIPPAHILKIIPFYQKNSEFKRKKENVEDTMS